MKVDKNTDLNRYEWANVCMKKIVPNSKNKKVADVGCKNDRLKEKVENIGGEWYGFDLHPKRESVRKWNIEKGNKRKENFGLVLMLDVIEHLGNPWMGVKNISASMCENGYLVMTTPNPMWSRSRFHALAKGYPSCFDEGDLRDNHHVFTPWPHIVEKMLNDFRLDVEKYVTLDGKSKIPKDPSSPWYLVRATFAMTRVLMEKYDKSSCGMSYGILAKKS
jgi:hypothetical protein